MNTRSTGKAASIFRGILVPTGLAVLSLLIGGCALDCIEGSNQFETEERTTAPFDRVVLESSANVVITQADPAGEPNISIEAEDNILEALRTNVSSTTLTIDSDGRCYLPHEDVDIHLIMKDVAGLELSGSGRFSSTAPLTGTTLELSVPGSGAIDLDATVESLKLAIDGSGEMNLSGTTSDLQVDLGGSGQVKAFGVSSTNAVVQLGGSGNVEITASGTLDVTISGSGNVYYKGNPTIETHGSGSGSVINAN